MAKFDEAKCEFCGELTCNVFVSAGVTFHVCEDCLFSKWKELVTKASLMSGTGRVLAF